MEIGKALRSLGQDVQFFSHGGTYEWVARDAGFDVISVPPTMSPDRAKQYMAFNRADPMDGAANAAREILRLLEK